MLLHKWINIKRCCCHDDITMDINDYESAKSCPGHGRQFPPHQLNDVINLLITSLQVRTETTLRLQHLRTTLSIEAGNK